MIVNILFQINWKINSSVRCFLWESISFMIGGRNYLRGEEGKILFWGDFLTGNEKIFSKRRFYKNQNCSVLKKIPFYSEQKIFVIFLKTERKKIQMSSDISIYWFVCFKMFCASWIKFFNFQNFIFPFSLPESNFSKNAINRQYFFLTQFFIENDHNSWLILFWN